MQTMMYEKKSIVIHMYTCKYNRYTVVLSVDKLFFLFFHLTYLTLKPFACQIGFQIFSTIDKLMNYH